MSESFTPNWDESRRNALIGTCCVGAVGAAGVAVPLATTFMPSERAKAAGAPVSVDVSGMADGELRRVEWRGKPVWVVKRSDAMVKAIAASDAEVLDPHSDRFYQLPTPEYARNEHRSLKPELLVVVGICPHLGCSPSEKFQPGAQPSLPENWQGGFLCPCHGSTFDMAGRVFANKPANANLDVPPYRFVDDNTLMIGEDGNKQA